MTDTNNTWPDPARPGVPLNFEKDGWHWLKTERGLAPWRWKENPESIMWESGWEAGDGVISPAYFAALGPCTYLGPVLTPDEATALQKRVAKLEGALRFYADPFKYTDIHGDDVRVPHFYSETDFGETARVALGLDEPWSLQP